MEKCKLTQVPCRNEIERIIKQNKNRYSLQTTCEIAKLFQTVFDDEEYKELSEEDYARFGIISDIMRMTDLKSLTSIQSVVNYMQRSETRNK